MLTALLILPLPINSDKVSVSFWIKTSQTSIAMITELSQYSNNKNAFYIALREYFSVTTPQKIIDSNIKSNGNWMHYVFTANKETGKMEIFENKISIRVYT